MNSWNRNDLKQFCYDYENEKYSFEYHFLGATTFGRSALNRVFSCTWHYRTGSVKTMGFHFSSSLVEIVYNKQTTGWTANVFRSLVTTVSEKIKESLSRVNDNLHLRDISTKQTTLPVSAMRCNSLFNIPYLQRQ